MDPSRRQIGPYEVSKPRVPLPPGAWDCHAHCFGPFDRFPLPDGVTRRPVEAHAAQYVAMLDHVGMARGVLVHGSAYGHDNGCMIEALTDRRLVGIAIVPATSSEGDLVALRAQGVRGLRFSHGKSPGPGSLPLAALRPLGPILGALGMQAHVWADCADILAHAEVLVEAGCPLVLDHMAMPAPGAGPAGRDFVALRELVAQTGAFIKLTPHRISTDWPLARDVRALHEALCEAVPDRLVWGSDWPFLGMQDLAPDVGQRLDLLHDWTPDAAVLRRILVDNPAHLFSSKTKGEPAA